MEKARKHKKSIITVMVIIIQMIFCIMAGNAKQGFFCDEIYSYGLSNSENYTFIDPETARQYSDTGWVDKQYFEDYIQVSKDLPFSFHAVFENQKRDVHPPLYYCFLHLLSLLNHGVFTKWTGLALNFILLFFTDLIMLSVSDYLLKDRRLSCIALLFWTFSGAGLSNILFIRMYVMLTFEMLAYVAVHIQILKKQKADLKDCLLMLLTVACGGLTHYYFYLFVCFFSAPVCLYWMLHKNLKKLFFYAGNLCAGVGIALCIFPSTIDHILHGYRGTEVIDNLTHGRGEEVMKTYLKMIDNSIFAGIFKICLGFVVLMIIGGVLLKYFVNFKWKYNQKTRMIQIDLTRKRNVNYGNIHIFLGNERILEMLFVLSYGLFALTAIKGSGIVHNRYLYPIYPAAAIVIIQIFSGLLKVFLHSMRTQYLVIFIISIVLDIGSLSKYGIDFQYTGYHEIAKQAEAFRETDCLLYYGDGWLDIYTGFPLRMLHKNTYFMRPEEIGRTAEILSGRETHNPLTVCLPAAYSEEDTRELLDSIAVQTGFTNYGMIYRYEYLQEWWIE